MWGLSCKPGSVMSCKTLFVVGLFLASQAWAGRDIPPGIDKFFDHPACSVGGVADISYPQSGIVVTLTIDPRWARALARKKSEDLRRSWFGIHCPVYDPQVWNELAESEDILITAVLPKFGPYVFSCREQRPADPVE